MSTIAVVLALGGGAYAVGLGRNSVGSKQLRPGAVKLKDTATSLRLKCAAGTRYHEGACIETAPRGTGDWTAAMLGCSAAGRRLPSPSELMGFAREPGITVGPGPQFEWAGVFDNDPPDVYGLGVLAVGADVVVVSNPVTDQGRYRCVANALG